MQITGGDIAAMDDRYRVFFVNSLSGFKSANLIGTASPDGIHNLCMVSSVVHIGSNLFTEVSNLVHESDLGS